MSDPTPPPAPAPAPAVPPCKHSNHVIAGWGRMGGKGDASKSPASFRTCTDCGAPFRVASSMGEVQAEQEATTPPSAQANSFVPLSGADAAPAPSPKPSAPVMPKRRTPRKMAVRDESFAWEGVLTHTPEPPLAGLPLKRTPRPAAAAEHEELDILKMQSDKALMAKVQGGRS